MLLDLGNNVKDLRRELNGLRKLIDEMPEIMTSLRTKDLEQTLEYFYFLLQVIGCVLITNYF